MLRRNSTLAGIMAMAALFEPYGALLTRRSGAPEMPAATMPDVDPDRSRRWAEAKAVVDKKRILRAIAKRQRKNGGRRS